jgi:hypothetical protein
VVGVYLSTVIGWYKRYSMEGMSGLKSKVCVRRYLSGWAPALAKEWQLRSVIVGENPKQLTLPFGLWSRWAVMRLVKVLFNIEMPIRTVGEYMLHLRYAPLQPMRRALEQSPFGVEQWLNDIYPTNAAGTKAEGAVVCWGGETAVAEDGHWLRSSAPTGQGSALAAPGKHAMSWRWIPPSATRRGALRVRWGSHEHRPVHRFHGKADCRQPSESVPVSRQPEGALCQFGQRVAGGGRVESKSFMFRPARQRSIPMNISSGTSRPSFALLIASPAERYCFARRIPS